MATITVTQRALEEAEVRIDLAKMLKELEWDERHALIVALADLVAGSDFVDALADNAAPSVKYEGKTVQPLTERGTVILDCFVTHAQALGRLPEDWVSDEMAHFGDDVDRLHEAICDGRTADACDLLRQMLPSHPFMSDKARTMLRDVRQGALAL